jgi:PAS domain S-box-containing protein
MSQKDEPLMPLDRAPSRRIIDLVPGDHVCSLYEGEQQRRDLLEASVRHGLDRNEQVLCLVSAPSAAALTRALSDGGVDVDAAVTEGRLILVTGAPAARTHGMPAFDSLIDAGAMTAWLCAESERAAASGHAALRFAWEPSEMLRESRPGRLLEYERALDEFVHRARCLVTCHYDRGASEASLLLDVLREHPIGAIGFELYDNPWYMPPSVDAAGRLRRRLELFTERSRAETASFRLAAIVESADDAILSWNLDGTIVSWNRGAERLYDFPAADAIGRFISVLVPPDRVGEFQGIVDKVKRGETIAPFDTVRLRRDGTPVHVSLTVSPIRDARGRVVGASAIARDISERRRTDAQLRSSEERFRSIFDHSLDAIILGGLDGRILAANRAACEMFGRTEDELRRVGRAGTVDESDPRLQAILDERRRTGKSRGELRLLRKDGSTFDGEVSGALFRDDAGNERMALIVRDISERKRAEAQLVASREELRALTARLASVREDERHAIADELGEDLAQRLVTLKWQLARLCPDMAADRRGLAPRFESMVGLLDDTIQALRRMSAELRPSLLVDLGLVPALEWEAREFQTRSGVACQFQSTAAEISIDAAAATALVRIAQHALGDVGRHAGATSVAVTLREDAEQVVLTIEDNGRGITSEEATSPGSLGIVEMRERAAASGGAFTIAGQPGRGTTVTVTMPHPRTEPDPLPG